MIKVSSVILTVLVGLLMVGCGKSEDAAAVPVTGETSTPPAGKGGMQSMGATPGPGSASGDGRVGSQAQGG